MAIFEKIDRQPDRRDTNLCKPVSQPDATGFSGVSSDETDATPCAFFADDSEEDSLQQNSVPIAGSIGDTAAQKPGISND